MPLSPFFIYLEVQNLYSTGLKMSGKIIQEEVEQLASELEDKSPQEVLSWAVDRFKDNLGIASSFGAEDVVLIDLAVKIDANINVFTLDTGRLPEETYGVWDKMQEKYGIKIKSYHPDGNKVEKLLRERGPYSFKASVENRVECCNIRKVEPLKRALSGWDAWVTGLRRSQSVTRTELKKIGVDSQNGGILKINPLADWENEQVWDYIKENNVPYNKLHDIGFASIGCEPCTRAIKPGEDIRSGRWWWENPESKECGLHGTCKVE